MKIFRGCVLNLTRVFAIWYSKIRIEYAGLKKRIVAVEELFLGEDKSSKIVLRYIKIEYMSLKCKISLRFGILVRRGIFITCPCRVGK
ncbi:MAG: hypothetical protein N3G21_12620 [Candidatus Hydrogenedentes bacterium]|nr:hypothetical protein [Candidatus Hydrogenedentota bacterium]